MKEKKTLDLSGWAYRYYNITADHGQVCEDQVHEQGLSRSTSMQMKQRQTGAFSLRIRLACASASQECTSQQWCYTGPDALRELASHPSRYSLNHQILPPYPLFHHSSSTCTLPLNLFPTDISSYKYGVFVTT